MPSYTQEVLRQGGFDIDWHPDLAEDISAAEAVDPGCWADISAVLKRIKDGSYRSDDWDAPLDRRHADLGEIKRRAGQRLYRLYVHASRDKPGVVTLLVFGSKPAGPAGLALQDDQIDLAFSRLMGMSAQ
ncbi:hypothetical protein AWC06_08950 [Mycobacterium fragae]|uniref:Addiction module toxin RelE n=1 Tax=Mycobacterium fragae TaxID=1260918 RepID=A0A1X1V2Y4_9MYCO|nr:hypothetical protein AWC06_08950 [Mycobacterium fragae]